MLSGASPSGGYPWSFITNVKTAHTAQEPPSPEVHNERPPPAKAIGQFAPAAAAEDAEFSLARDFTLFDLAHREFSQILPKIEMLTEAVE